MFNDSREPLVEVALQLLIVVLDYDMEQNQIMEQVHASEHSFEVSDEIWWCTLCKGDPDIRDNLVKRFQIHGILALLHISTFFQMNFQINLIYFCSFQRRWQVNFCGRWSPPSEPICF